MRKDVKAGMALALIVVIVAGWYYSRDPSSQSTITLGPEPAPAHRDVPAANPPNSRNPRKHGPRPDHPMASAPTSDVQRSAQNTTDAVSLTANRQSSSNGDVRVQALTGPVSDQANRRGAKPQESPARSEPETAAAGDLAAIEVYRVQPGDTLAGLAEVYYGSRRHVALILRANPQVRDPNVLRVGTEIRLPAVPGVTRVVANPAPGPTSPRPSAPGEANPRSYTVKAGDSFYAIAERVLGSGARWPELLELNRKLVNGDPLRLRPGMALRLPPE